MNHMSFMAYFHCGALLLYSNGKHNNEDPVVDVLFNDNVGL